MSRAVQERHRPCGSSFPVSQDRYQVSRHPFLARGTPFVSRYQKRKWERLRKDWEWPIEVRGGFKGLLFRGLAANWGEFRFYWQTGNPFVQPTYFSLFGLLNIQRADEPCLLKDEDLWCQLYELTKGQVFDDSHHFVDPRNFCFCNGKLRMLDYGSRKSRGVIARHGAKIVELFNPAYCWEEEKKKIKEKREASN